MVCSVYWLRPTTSLIFKVRSLFSLSIGMYLLRTGRFSHGPVLTDISRACLRIFQRAETGLDPQSRLCASRATKLPRQIFATFLRGLDSIPSPVDCCNALRHLPSFLRGVILLTMSTRYSPTDGDICLHQTKITTHRSCPGGPRKISKVTGPVCRAWTSSNSSGRILSQ
jgi:hypothetical protein